MSKKHKSAKPRMVQQHEGITTTYLDRACTDTLSDLNIKYFFEYFDSAN